MTSLDEEQWQQFDQMVEELRQLAPPDQKARLETWRAQGESSVLLSFVEQELRLSRLSTDDLSGITLAGKYRLLKKIGEGGMGVVYQATRHTAIGEASQTVAVKLIKRGLPSEAEKRFTQEVDQLKNIHVANVIGLLDAEIHRDTDDSLPKLFYVMPYIAGVALHEYVQREQPAMERRLELFLTICDAVHMVHLKHGIIHRDLKPENILVDEGGKPWVTDFGLAFTLDSSHPLTAQRGLTSGTPRYMSPEQLGIFDAEIREQSDLYSLGLILQELVTPQTRTAVSPEEQQTVICPAFQQGDTDWSGLPIPELKPVLQRALLTDPADRFPSLMSFRLEVERCWKLIVAQNQRAAPSPDLFHVPLRPNPCFQGRGDLLHQLESEIAQAGDTRICVLSGLGGVGKTQTAVELAYRLQGKRKRVLWFSAETREELLHRFKELADQFHLGVDGSRPDQLIQAVRNWFDLEDRTLLIFDNADEPELLADFLPANPQIAVLVTSRSADCSALGVIQPTPLEVLSLEEGSSFLFERTGLPRNQDSEQLARQLVAQLGGLPLALEQAGAYLHNLGITFEEYQEDFQELHGEIFTTKEATPALGDVSRTVATTWRMNIQYLQQNCPAATELLALGSLLAPDQIPFEFWREEVSELPDLLAHELQQRRGLEKLLRELNAFSLIQRDAVGKQFSIHRLVQQTVRESLSQSQQNQYRDALISTANHRLPEDPVENWDRYGRFLPHLLQLNRWLPETAVQMTPSSCEFLIKTARFLQERWQFSDAIPMFESALKGLQTLNRQGTEIWSRCVVSLATLLRDQGAYDRAEPLLVDALKIAEQAFGAEHPQCGHLLDAYGKLCLSQGKYSEAETVHRKALQLRRNLNERHVADIADSLNNLACVMYECGRLEEALPLNTESMELRQRHLGEHHPRYAISLNNLGILYQYMGLYPLAEELQLQAMNIRRTYYGENHFEYGNCLNAFGTLYRRQGRLEEAIAFQREAFRIYEQSLGLADRHTLSCLNNLGLVYQEAGFSLEAEQYYRQGIEIIESLYDTPHIRTARLCGDLAVCLASQQRREEAFRFFEKSRTLFRELAPLHQNWQQQSLRYAELLIESEFIPSTATVEEVARFLRETDWPVEQWQSWEKETP